MATLGAMQDFPLRIMRILDHAEREHGRREIVAARADGNTVRLLVHALRGATGAVRDVRFGRARLGHAPHVNSHSEIAPTYSAV
jgi:hypothetical protein